MTEKPEALLPCPFCGDAPTPTTSQREAFQTAALARGWSIRPHWDEKTDAPRSERLALIWEGWKAKAEEGQS